MRSEPYLHFWGKAQGEREGEPSWHPAAYHNLDVAAVADVLLRQNPRRLSAMASRLGTSPQAARSFLVSLIAHHDIGKFAAAFQAIVPAHYPSDHLKLWQGNTRVRHDLTASVWRDVIEEMYAKETTDWGGSDFACIWHAVSGHHGQPRTGDPQRHPQEMTREGQNAAKAFMVDCAALFPNRQPLTRPNDKDLAILSWAVAGLTVMSDWIGSNRDWFAYRAPDLSLAEYWAEALGKAEAAIAKAGVQSLDQPPKLDAHRLLPRRVAANLSPLQKFAQDVELPHGPMLAIVEDVTGSGKTEAALLLAARLMQTDRASGIFFALPTMATANAMYARLEDAYRNLFTDDAQPSLVLAHGKKALHAKFQGSITLAPTLAPKGSGETTGDESGAACAAWIADSGRKAFLAHVGVGTIDQALLGVLPSKFQSLRLWGLADRVLIIDEAHAYDSYMSREIETLLEFHAALGGSAIILSATLPQTVRRALIDAYGRGLGFVPKISEANDYPLITIVDGETCTQHCVATREDRTRVLPVRRIGSVGDAIAHVKAVSSADGAVAWIRNSVDDAIEAVELLKAHDVTPVLLHARFAMGHRLDIEAEVTKTLGRTDETGRRRGFVLVGTQILEQSLDYDVDGMITDLAPIDKMIQRAGRLWRHTDRTERPDIERELMVLSPDPTDVPDANWCAQISKRSAAVYDHHGIVWRSAKVLFETRHISTPGDIRNLIEHVYGPEACGIHEKLIPKSGLAEGRTAAERSIAKANVLKLADGYAGDITVWTSDTITPTRLGQPVTVFRLGKVEGGKIVPLCQAEDDSLKLSWALSEVSIATYRANGVPEATGQTGAMIVQAKSDWPMWERDLPLLVLHPDGDRWRGVATKTGDGDKQAHYCNRLGLRFV
jgi:CRISPR-associated endonuclease/helicase Cas3